MTAAEQQPDAVLAQAQAALAEIDRELAEVHSDLALAVMVLTACDGAKDPGGPRRRGVLAITDPVRAQRTQAVERLEQRYHQVFHLDRPRAVSALTQAEMAWQREEERRRAPWAQPQRRSAAGD
jgi:hypothetical protein